MRLAVLGLAALLAAPLPARADRAADFSAGLVGADADTRGVGIDHDARGWTMRVRPRPGAAERRVAVAAPATHGDYVVFVAPGRGRVAWIRVGDVNGRPAASDPAVWIYKTKGLARGRVRTIAFGELFTADELAALPISSAGMTWLSASSPPAAAQAVLTLPAFAGKPVIVDLAGGSAIRAH